MPDVNGGRRFPSVPRPGRGTRSTASSRRTCRIRGGPDPRAASWTGMGHRRLLGGWLSCRESRASSPMAIWLRRCDERLFPADGQPYRGKARHPIYRSVPPQRALRMQHSHSTSFASCPPEPDTAVLGRGGRAVRGDVMKRDIRHAAQSVGPGHPLTITRDGAHNAVAWRSMIPPMLEWMAPRLTQAAAAQGCQACLAPTVGAPPRPTRAVHHITDVAGSSYSPSSTARPSRLNQDRVRGSGPRPAGARPSAALAAGRLQVQVSTIG